MSPTGIHGLSPTERMTIVAVGSNLGDSKAAVLNAFDAVESLFDRPCLKSSLWETTPVDCPPNSPQFINAIVVLEVPESETPEAMLAKLQRIESDAGRRRGGITNEARSLDLDLIAFAEEIRNGPALVLPHPRAHLRRFVLAPLVELLPGFRAPGWPDTAANLLAKLPSQDKALRLD